MAVITFKEDTITPILTDTFINSDGDPEKLMDQKGEPIKCDAEPNGAAQTITLEDGQKKQYSYTVTLAPDCPSFQAGDRVLLARANGERQEAEVLGFHRYQLHSKMWI